MASEQPTDDTDRQPLLRLVHRGDGKLYVEDPVAVEKRAFGEVEKQWNPERCDTETDRSGGGR